MRCGACDQDNPERAKFCVECGTPVVSCCAACATELPPGSKFCLECGASTTAASPPSATVPAAPPAPPTAPASEDRTPKDYTPKHLADRILRSKSALEGERKRVTVLFADVKGSMEVAEQLDPEEWHRILEHFFEILTEGVHRFEGTVNQYTGDGIMALFGAPLAHEDHAERACYAALQVRKKVRAYANTVRAQHGVPFGVRIGLNSGEVVVGKIGDDLRMDYTAQGHTVGLAQRMEALAESGHICVSEHTAALVEGYFELTDLGRTQIKGVEGPVGLFELEGVGEFRTRLDRSRARGLSTFVGRAGDMAFLEAALERARGSSGQVVGVVAEAGTGKSRLCAEFIDSCRARGIPILEGRGVAHGKSIPMLPMLELWRNFYEIAEGDSPEATRAKIAGRLLMMDEGYRDVLPIVFEVFGVPDPENPAPALDPEVRQKRLHGVVKRILQDPGYTGTRVFLLEDLHWFDGASDGFLETIVESSPATRDLLLLNFRPEYQTRWMQRSYYQQLALQPLDPEAIRALLRDWLGEDPSVASLPEAVHERTAGNPFFIEEVAQSLVESGHLVGERGAYRLTTALDALEVPASVHAVLAARIDRLPEREKQVLQTASVIGKTFPELLLRSVVERTAGLGEVELGEALSALVGAEFLFEASLYPDLEYSFKHPLTQEVALGSQLRDKRRAVHAAVASTLETSETNLDEHAAEIAQHWDEAGDDDQAALWYRRAAQWAALSDVREALGHWRRVREHVARLPESSERDQRMLEACVRIFGHGWRMGGSEAESEEIFLEGRALAERLGDRHTLARLVGSYGLMRSQQTGSATDYIRYGEESAAIAAELGDPGLRAAIGTWPAFGYFYVGAGHRVLEWVSRVLEDAGPDGTVGRDVAGYSPGPAMLQAKLSALIYLGRLDEAWPVADEAARAAEAVGDTEVRSWVHVCVTILTYTMGGGASSVDEGRRCLEIGERLDNDSSRVLGHMALGQAHLADAQPDLAREAFHHALSIAHDQGVQLAFMPLTLALLAQAHLDLGEPGEALRVARDGIDRATICGVAYPAALAEVIVAAALIAEHGATAADEVEAALGRAAAIVESLDARSLAPRILEQRSRLAGARGENTERDALSNEALALFREIGARGHVERLERDTRPSPD